MQGTKSINMKKYFIILILFFSITKIQSQPGVMGYISDIDNLEKSTLYVVIDSSRSDDQKYADLITEIWKFCKIEVIEYKEIYNHVNNHSYFFTPYVTYFMHKTTYSKETDRLQIFKLAIWGFMPDFLKDYKKNPQDYKDFNFMRYSFTSIAIELTPDISKTFTIDKTFSNDYMGKGYISTYGEGLFKNYIQCLNKIIYKKEICNFHHSSYNPTELKKLNSSTLYIPEYIVNEYKNKYITDKFQKLRIEYPYKYEIISMENLNELILDSETPIYYLTSYRYFVKDFRNRTTFTITNSVTGDIIFSDFVRRGKDSYSPRLMKILSKKIIKCIENSKESINKIEKK